MEPASRPDPTVELALRSLKDIVEPAPVSWLPQTWGWAAFGVLILLTLCWFTWRQIRRHHANAYRREALAQLSEISLTLGDPLHAVEGEQVLALLLKRVALAAWPRAATAGLAGGAWARFLDDSLEPDAGRALRELLDDGEYRSSANTRLTPDQLIAAARKWIEGHHAPV